MINSTAMTATVKEADYAAALEIEGPDPCPPVAHTVESHITKEWSLVQSLEKWH